MRKLAGIIICIAATQFLFAQQTIKQLPAKRTTQTIKIDGLITDSAWQDASIMQDLIEFRPNVGLVENPGTRTVSYLLYSDEGVYFGGYCFERTKDSIARELVGRDGFGTNDYVGIIFDTYYDQLNGFEYFVTPLNEQWDAKMSPNLNGNPEDFSWNSVWESGAVIHEDGWSFEMFIPFSAIRFGKKDVQDWGLNITRRRRKTEQQFTWNPINPNVNGFLTQEGKWVGLTNIKPPLRLQLSPYFSIYANHYPFNQPGVKDWTSSVNGGLDLKYGINQAFTLDVTLIPDFGQVQSDDRILNLSPFEVRFDENRPFFTEGTELFGKGNLFYSKRIGTYPILLHSPDETLGPNEEVIKAPLESKLINATKISGRTQRGLGVGILNAITNTRYATIRDVMTGDTRKEIIDPLTNYNIIVLDQTLKNNSSVSFINTNVWRSGSDYDANVSAVLFDLNDKSNTWNVGGNANISNQVGFNDDRGTRTGFSHVLYFGKSSGDILFRATQGLSDRRYSSNDFGFFNFNNYIDHSFWLQRRWIKPTSWYNNFRVNFNLFYNRQLNPSKYRNAMINVNANGQFKNLWFAGVLIAFEPEYNDFYEPRVEGRVFRGWESRFVEAWVETNQAKKYSAYAEFMFVSRSLFKSRRYGFEFNHRFRISDKFSIGHEIEIEPQTDNTGFATIYGNDIIFGRRDVNTVENSMYFKYNFNAKMGLNLRLRHYWTKVVYKEFFTLTQDGGLGNTSFNENEDQNVNFFNVDMVYTWEFAPGSFLNIVWKDAAATYADVVERDYFKNFESTVRADQNNNISLKVIYFLDYLKLRRALKK